MPFEFIPPKRMPYKKYWETRDFYDLEESYRIDEELYQGAQRKFDAH